MPLFSALDQAPRRRDARPGAALHEAVDLATHLEGLGYTRFWIAEHHAMGGVESSSPEVLIGHVASATTRLRVGSGAVLLPNHTPLHVAEQFRTLEALHPGRIDLGIGRSEGALDEKTVLAFGRPQDNAHGAGFEEQLDRLLAFGGARALPDDHELAGIEATPPGVPLPPVYLLGSSANSAATAARKGLGYGFAAYSNSEVVAEALQTYRAEFVPARDGDRPYAILGLRVVVGESDEHALAIERPWHLTHVQLRAGTPSPMMSVREAAAYRLTDAELGWDEKIDRRADAIGDPETVRAKIDALVEATGADEVIVSTNTYDPADRRASYARLAAVYDLAPVAA